MKIFFDRKLGFELIKFLTYIIRGISRLMGGYPDILDAHNRGYVEDYISKHRGYIKRADKVLEFEGSIAYSEKYNPKVKMAAWSEHKERWKGCDYYFDLTDAGTLPQEKFDCIVLTEVLNCVIDVNLVLENLKRLLTDRGILIITVHGPVLCDSDFFGFYSRYGIEQICKRHFRKVFNIEEYGDFNHAVAALLGIGRIVGKESIKASDHITITTGLCCQK